MPKYGSLDPFDPDSGPWQEYLEREQQFFAANEVPDAKKHAVFLRCCGSRTYSILRSLLAPNKPTETTLENCLKTLSDHFSPKPLIVVSRFTFNSRVREEGESLSEFVDALKKLSEHCEFGTFLKDLLRDRIVCGIRDTQMQTRLLEEPNLTVGTAVLTALAIESVKRDASELCVMEGAVSANVNVIRTSDKKHVSCYRCGDAHYATECPHIRKICSYCRKVGHLARVCQSRDAGSNHRASTQQFKKNNANKQVCVPAVEDSHHSTPKSVQRSAVSSSDEETVYNMWNLVPRPSVPAPKPFTVQLEVQGRPFRMELDTGASVSIIGKSTLPRQFPSLPRQPSEVQLRSYCGDLKPVAGKVTVLAKYNHHVRVLPLLIAEGDAPSLLGRNWIEALNIPVFNVADVCALSDVQQLIDQQSILYSDGPGTFQGVSVKLSVQEGAKPRFFKARTVPFALVDNVSEELLRLQREHIQEAVASSEWTAPIVPVLKKDGSLRICEDYKVTVNPVAVVDKYPIPKAEELWVRLSGGVKFTKLDRKDAYQQLVLELTSRKLTTINTPKGLLQYKRLPFGVSAAPSVFQREMETLLQGLHHVVVYFDDTLVTGTDDKDHLNNLGKVFQGIEERGLKLKHSKCKSIMDSLEYLGHVIDT
ncbi:uncharacterized protein K02A2.6-like [Dermacentor silvarum]|uniref:uncharacterized protein K02A2.6-like n=1 Tax=Dermacentor silvarum TaxID=543639 RepID=UPI0021009B44|nr:uncharacterized protein K02A2.6-like [Dermacentor silvarum]